MNAVQDYISMNLETLLESHMLDNLTLPLIKQLTLFIGQRQRDTMQVTRSDKILDRAMVDFGSWLSLQDIPSPIVQKVRPAFRESPKLSPGMPVIGTPHRRVSTAGNDLGSPTIRPAASPPPTSAVQSTDEIFSMDDIDALPPPSLMPTTKQAAWKPSMTPRYAIFP
jgi:inhibitor of Bruton tyrosine kinase